jgi:very-short-patch-repair endonuclease
MLCAFSIRQLFSPHHSKSSLCEGSSDRAVIRVFTKRIISEKLSIDEINRTSMSSECHDVICIFPQVDVEGYRLDLVAMHTYNGVTNVIGIECDGHNFHEKTKEQVARDKAKDRSLLCAGMPIMRFSGSEIWEDALECANQVIVYLYKRRAPLGDVPKGAGDNEDTIYTS